jgi:hypothetical protein
MMAMLLVLKQQEDGEEEEEAMEAAARACIRFEGGAMAEWFLEGET